LAGISIWRTNDVVAYEAMRESATTLTTLLSQVPDGDSSSTEPKVLKEMTHLLESVRTVDAYDRGAVVDLADKIHHRIIELTESQP